MTPLRPGGVRVGAAAVQLSGSRLEVAHVDAFAAQVRAKGKVPSGKYRAYGHQAPGHRIADLKLKWRELQMHALGLNRDATFRPKQSEADRCERKD